MSKTLRVANGDWDVDSRGRPIYIEGREKVAQDVANVLLQELYADASYGSELARVERSTIVDTANAHRAIIQTLVGEAVERLQALQEQEETIPREERIVDYTVIVDRMTQQQLAYSYYLAVTTEASNDPVEQTYVIEIEHVRDPSFFQD